MSEHEVIARTHALITVVFPLRSFADFARGFVCREEGDLEIAPSLASCTKFYTAMITFPKCAPASR